MGSVRKVLRGNLLIFTLGDAVRQLSIFITFPYFSRYIQALGGSTVDIGLVNSVGPLAALFIYPIAGYLADRYSRVKIVAASAYISVAPLLIFFLAPDWRFLALGNFLMGLIVFQFPAMNSLMADSLPPKQWGMGYSLWIAIPSAVGIISPYIGGYLITILGVEQAMKFLYGLSAVVTAGIGIMDLKFLRETRIGKGTDASGEGFLRVILSSFQDMLNVLRWLPRSLKAFMLMLILSFFFNSLTSPYWVVYGVRIGLSELEWGTILLAAAIVNAVLLVPAGVVVDRFDVRKVLSLALVLSAAPIFLFPLSQSFAETALSLVAMTTANAFLTSGAPAFMAHSVPSDKRGRVMAALGQGMLFINTRGGAGGPGMGAVLTIPSMLGSILGGFVYSYNPALPWFLLAVSMMVSALIPIILLSSTDEERGKPRAG